MTVFSPADRDRMAALCVEAHLIALERGTLTPAERPEWVHYRLRWVKTENGKSFPVLDPSLMRDDQAFQVLETLERMTGRQRAANTYEKVRDFMFEHGHSGWRWNDVADMLVISGKSVRNALVKLEAQGEVRVKEEPTRPGGSQRKRYYSTLDQPDYGSAHPATGMTEEGLLTIEDDLYYIPNVGRNSGDTSIRYHGTAVQGVTCRCLMCSEAIQSYARHEADWSPQRK